MKLQNFTYGHINVGNIKKIKMKKIIFISLLIISYSCSTYTIPTESFKTQFSNFDSIQKRERVINNPMTYGTIKYMTNNIMMINAIDKNNNPLTIRNSASLEMRVTKKNGTKNVFYFDTVTLENDTLKGSQSRFLPKIRKEIPFNDIIKIEIQDGGKNYNYQN
jgi:signal peptidase I